MSGEEARPLVIVVEDEPQILYLICDLLDEHTIPSLPCGDSTRAFRLIRERQPELVILDVQMPKVDGIEIFLQLRADPATVNVPVIFLTANAHLIAAYPQIQATVVAKPFSVDILIGLIKEYIGAAPDTT